MVELLPEDWKTALKPEFEKPYFARLSATVDAAYTRQTVYPPRPLLFEAFRLCPLQNVKVVILGQDPYHGPSQAHGLSFSVNPGIKFPPSLRNIFKELLTDQPPYEVPMDGDLRGWAQQGVLLLNAVLTVEAGVPGSHARMGWESFTDRVIELVSETCPHVVFLLWGNFAGSKAPLIKTQGHLILKAAHPSPLARGAFFGSKHFSQANAFLTAHGRTAIKWQL
jgi:uracil-DNA glycosylase